MKSRIGIADTLAFITLLLAVIAAAAGLLIAGLYRDTTEAIRQARATDLVTLLVAAPLLGFALRRAHSGSVIARLGLVGALGYLAYSYAIFAFSVVINPLTPVHIAILGVASWALALNVTGLDRAAIERTGQLRLPRRTAGGLLFVVAALFGLLWLGQIGAAIASGQLPPAVSDLGLPTSPVYTLDLAFALPAMVISALWLVRHDPRGAAATLATLSFLTLLGLSVLAIFAVDAAAGLAIALEPALIFGIVTALSAAIAIRAVLPAPHAALRSVQTGV